MDTAMRFFLHRPNHNNALPPQKQACDDCVYTQMGLTTHHHHNTHTHLQQPPPTTNENKQTNSSRTRSWGTRSSTPSWRRRRRTRRPTPRWTTRPRRRRPPSELLLLVVGGETLVRAGCRLTDQHEVGGGGVEREADGRSRETGVASSGGYLIKEEKGQWALVREVCDFSM